MLKNMRVFIAFRVLLYSSREVATSFANITHITHIADNSCLQSISFTYHLSRYKVLIILRQTVVSTFRNFNAP